MYHRSALILFCLAIHSDLLAADPVHVLIWDERQPRQSQAYDNFLGNEIASRLDRDQFETRSVWLEDPGQGLEAGNLEWADFIVWWGHVRHSDVSEANAKRILDYVKQGKLDLIALHSAHWARPFVEAMNWRSVEVATAQLKKLSVGKELTMETVSPPRERTVPIHGSLLTPAIFGYKKSNDRYHGILHLPYCCFPDYRADGKPSTIRVQQADHPIAEGLPKTFQIVQTEMYNEPFHVPDPDEVIFEEVWAGGERFRSGMVWNIGQGKVFYFRPGHETYPVFKQQEVMTVIANACRWLGSE